MENIKVADLTVPLSEYATVPDDASLYDAVIALENAQEKYIYPSLSAVPRRSPQG